MLHTMVVRKIEKTAAEMYALVKKSKRKLLEFEVMLSLAAIREGKYGTAKTAKALLKKIG